MANAKDNATPDVILFDSPEAAERTTVEAWKSRKGHIFLDERSARWDGCTNSVCATCGAFTPKHWRRCDDCRLKQEREEYDAMPREEWDGKAMLYSQATDEYYSDLDAADWALDDFDDGATLADLRLVICVPVYARQLDDDFFCDDLPDDGEVPDTVREAMEVFNKAIAGVVLSWVPGKTALALTTQQEAR